MSEHVYPQPAPEPPVCTLEDSEIAAIIVAARQAGKTRVVGELEATSACGTDSDAKRVSAEIEVERAAFDAVNPLDYATGAQYKAALAEVSVYLDVDIWLDALAEKYGVSTFAELKALLTPEE